MCKVPCRVRQANDNIQYTGADIFLASKSQSRLKFCTSSHQHGPFQAAVMLSVIKSFDSITGFCLSSSLSFIRAVLRKLPKQTYRSPVVDRVASVIASRVISVRTLISNKRSWSCCLLRFASATLRANASMSIFSRMLVAISL